MFNNTLLILVLWFCFFVLFTEQRCVNKYPVKMISIFFIFYLFSSFSHPCTIHGEGVYVFFVFLFCFFFGCAIGHVILVLFSFTDSPPRRLASRACKPRASPSQAIIESFLSQPWFTSCMSLALSLTILQFCFTVFHACLSAC